MKRKQPKSPKLTPWFDASVRPVHIGVYEVDDKDGLGHRWFAYWDGTRFWRRSIRPTGAWELRGWPSRFPTRAAWRGLA